MNDNEYNGAEQDVKAEVTRIASEMVARTPARVREEDVYTRPTQSDFEERGTEAQIAKLYGALASARGHFLPIKKTREVVIRDKDEKRVKYRFQYAPMEVLLESTTPALAAYGLVVMMPFVTGREQVTKQLLIVAHADGGRLVFGFEFSPADDEKTFGSQTTYLQRYCYRSVLTLAADGDLDEQPSRADEGSAEAGPFTKPTSNGKAQPAQTRQAAPASAPASAQKGEKSQAVLRGEMLSLAKKTGLGVRSQVAEFVWETVSNGEIFHLGDEPFCCDLSVEQLEQCLEVLNQRWAAMQQPPKAAGAKS